MAKQYIYAVTRIHNMEQDLLTHAELEQLISAPNTDEVLRVLADKGWGSPEIPSDDVDALVAFETDRTWATVKELVGDLAPFNVLRITDDFHNLKAAVKLAYSADEENEQGQYFLNNGTVPVDAIVKAANEHDFSALPPAMAEAGRAAYEALAHTGSGQAGDMAVDSATLVALDDAGKASGNKLLKRYAQLTVDLANIKAAVRSCLMNKGRDFIELAIAPAGTLNTRELANAAADSVEAIYAYLEHTDYAGGVDALKTSLAAFERYSDNQMIELIRPVKYEYFTAEPIAAYVLAKQNEIRMVRLILSAKINNLSADALRERLRDTYV